MKSRGLLLVVSGPSGAGKGTVCKALMKKQKDIHLSVSATTRKPRTGEVEGQSYYFLEEDIFKNMIDNNEFIEWACFCQNYYGTPKAKVEQYLNDGKDVILEIEVQGAMKVRSAYPEAVFLFVLPPSMSELKKRITQRGTESESVIQERLETAAWEFSHIAKYNYILLNDDVDLAVERFQAIIKAEKVRTERNIEFIKQVIEN